MAATAVAAENDFCLLGRFSGARSSARLSWHVSSARFICKHVLSLATIILLNDNDNDGALVLLVRSQHGVVHLPRWPPVPAQRVRRQRQPRAAVAVAVAGAGAAACQALCAAAVAACTLPPSTIVRAFFQIQDGGSSLFLQRAATASAAENYFVSQRHLQYSIYYVYYIDYILYIGAGSVLRGAVWLQHGIVTIAVMLLLEAVLS